LIASGASIVEAKELARHADIRQTAIYTHICIRARAEALDGLQYT
jgi:site-specific recombinase XerD